MKSARLLRAFVVVSVLVLSLVAMRGTAWAWSADQLTDPTTGVSWEGPSLAD